MAPSNGDIGAVLSVTLGGAVASIGRSKYIAVQQESTQAASLDAARRRVQRPGLFTLGLFFRPVTGIFVQERQRLHGGHSIEEQDTIEMIGLVLGDSRRKIAQPHIEALAIAVERPQRDVGVPRPHAADVGTAQTALPPLF